MESEVFARMRKRALREHKQSIVRTARNGHKAKGRGLVLVKVSQRGVHLSYLTLEALKDPRARFGAPNRGERLIRKISSYSPESAIPVLVTDGVTHRFSVGVRH